MLDLLSLLLLLQYIFKKIMKYAWCPTGDYFNSTPNCDTHYVNIVYENALCPTEV